MNSVVRNFPFLGQPAQRVLLKSKKPKGTDWSQFTPPVMYGPMNQPAEHSDPGWSSPKSDQKQPHVLHTSPVALPAAHPKGTAQQCPRQCLLSHSEGSQGNMNINLFKTAAQCHAHDSNQIQPHSLPNSFERTQTRSWAREIGAKSTDFWRN